MSRNDTSRHRQLRAVVGLPAHNGEQHLAQAIESLLAQSFQDFVLLIADDASTDGTMAIMSRYAAEDRRVVAARSDRRLGMAANWRRVYELARASFPEAPYFAWGSDHDVWHPTWLEELVSALDRDPRVVLAYPLDEGIDDRGVRVRGPWRFDTLGVEDRADRVRRVTRGMSAGNMIYGLMRTEALDRCGIFRPALLPDKLLLFELSLLGQFKQVPRTLWYRRYSRDVQPSLARQRVTLFAGAAPRYTYLSWWTTHAALLLPALLRRRSGPPDLGRSNALRFVATYYALNLFIERRKQLILVRARLLTWQETLRRHSRRLWRSFRA